MNDNTLKSTLGSLRKAGTIFGVLFCKEGEIVFSDLAYSEERVQEMSNTLDDITYYFEQEGRKPETLSFSYDGGNLLLMMRDGYRLVVLHHNSDEADFINKAARAFFNDFLTGMAVSHFSAPGDDAEKGTSNSVDMAAHRIGGKASFEPTTPIKPIV